MQPLTELGHNRQGQTKQGGQMGKHPPCQEEPETTLVHLSDTEYSYPPEEGPSPVIFTGHLMFNVNF